MTFLAGFEHITRENEPLAPHTWLRLGGPAEYFVEPTSEEELAAVVKRCRDQDMPVRLLGGGSNVLVKDEGAPGVVIRLSAPAFSAVTVEGNVITAAAGAQLSHLISIAVGRGLAGVEGLAGVPGTIGGALHGNTGSQGSDVGQCVSSATVMTRSGEILVRNRDDIHFAYRQSSLDELVILRADFALDEEERTELTRRMQKLWIVKKSRQPPTDQNVGRIFKNAGGVKAAELIEDAGLKGARFGEAEVSERHANFIVAAPGATSADVMRLIDLIRDQVSQRLGVELETQIQIW